MNSMNPRQNSRRRGRSNNNGGGGQRPNQGRGGDQSNRIDSRARGNAAQLLEKYRNMARDAQLSGDRVMTEYYLQFADHYFRVVSDSRSRQDEQRAPRFEDRDDDQNGADRADDSSNDASDDFDDGYGQQRQSAPRREEPRRESRERNDNRDRNDTRDRGNDRADNRERSPERSAERAPERAPRPPRAARPARDDEFVGATRGQTDTPRDADGDTDHVADAPRRRPLARQPRAERATNGHSESASIDVAVLPPAIGISAAPASAATTADDDAATPRRRTRVRKVAEDSADA